MDLTAIADLLDPLASRLAAPRCAAFPMQREHLPRRVLIDRPFALTDRHRAMLDTLRGMLADGRLGGTGYALLLPFDPWLDHSTSIAPRPDLFDPQIAVA